MIRCRFGWVAALLFGLSGCASSPNTDTASSTSEADSSEAESSSAGVTGDVSTQDAETSAGDGDGDGDGDGELECPSDPDAVLTAWQDGTNCGAEVELQVHRVDADTYVLRQSLCTNFEGPFLYLLFGEHTVLLEDTGAGGVDVVSAVTGVIDQVLLERGQSDIELLVLNSHGHGDHVAGNQAFVGLPGVTVVGSSQGEVSDYFGITDWPNQSASIDLGGRELTLLPIPGHHPSHVALYDPARRWLMTGDTLYPGRLYIADFGTYVQSIERMVSFTEGLDLCAVMGTHIEMTQTPGEDFSFGAASHPNEHGLGLTRDHLVELRDAVVAMDGVPQLETHDDFIIYPL